MSISQSFGFRNADLIFIFAPRDLGGHAFGRKVVELPFNDVYRFLTDRTINLLVGQQDAGMWISGTLDKQATHSSPRHSEVQTSGRS